MIKVSASIAKLIRWNSGGKSNQHWIIFCLWKSAWVFLLDLVAVPNGREMSIYLAKWQVTRSFFKLSKWHHREIFDRDIPFFGGKRNLTGYFQQGQLFWTIFPAISESKWGIDAMVFRNENLEVSLLKKHLNFFRLSKYVL